MPLENMSVVTSQQISKLYNQYHMQEVTFNKDVVRALLLNAKGVHIRCIGYQWPCVIFSSSMVSAKVIISTNSPIKQIVDKANRIVSLNLSFIQREKSDPISFFMKSKVSGYAPYHPEKPDLNYMMLEFAHRPPDDLIFRLGELLDAQTGASERKDERIILSPDIHRALKLPMKNAVAIQIEGVPRKCILRDISFGGAKVIIFGVPGFLVGKQAEITMKFEDPDQLVTIPGKVLRFEEVQGRKDLAAFAIQFTEGAIPVEYNLRLNGYFRSAKKKHYSSN